MFLIEEFVTNSKVLIPLRIRSISTLEKCSPLRSTKLICLNPFENQVYFYKDAASAMLDQYIAES